VFCFLCIALCRILKTILQCLAIVSEDVSCGVVRIC